MIDIKTIKQLIQLMKQNELSELDIRDKDEQVTLKRGGGGPVVMPQPVYAPAPFASATSPVPAPAAPAADAGPAIKSPMVGTCYLAQSPDAPPFVSVGTRVGPDTVVCLIEAMKVYNEIKAEMSGTITRIVPSNGQAVEFGQPLFFVKPD
jgi:acetyl-CoA carboxylase biotin carboxyl carrier protein